MARPEIVVGVGSDPRALAALDWAAAEAQARGVRLLVIRAYHLAEGVRPWTTEIDHLLIDDLRRATEHRAQHTLHYLRKTWPELEVAVETVDGVPSDVLIDRSAEGVMTVLGSRQLGALGAAALGSVSTLVAAAAHGPVVVVGRPGAASDAPGAVVVGVDGSQPGDAVLEFAFDYASRHGRPLHAVYCWRPDLLATTQWRAAQPAPERASRWLAELTAGWQEKYPEVVLQRGVVRDHPVAGLVAAAAGEDLLVVGSRSAHARVAALLGSVSQGVLHHATCPVAVVHPRS
jgi:nucleotide-binding universal stress UspA family protein